MVTSQGENNALCKLQPCHCYLADLCDCEAKGRGAEILHWKWLFDSLDKSRARLFIAWLYAQAKTIALMVLLFVASVTSTGANESMVEQMLSPTAQVILPNGSGSATAIKVNPYIGTYLLTNWHVVRNDRNNIEVQFYGETEIHRAYVHSVDVANDLAVIVTTYEHHATARIGKPPKLFTKVICVGASMGQPIAPSQGIVTGLDVKLFGTRYLNRMDCNIAPGNSGGGMYAFQDNEWQLVGVPTAVLSMPVFMGSVPVNFLGIAVRIQDVRAFLNRSAILVLPSLYGPH